MPNSRFHAVATLATALLFFFTLSASGQVPEAVPHVEASAHAFDSGHHTPPIPIQLASGKVHLPVRVDDAEPAWFILDTGANVTILDRAFADRLGLEVRGETTAKGAAGGDGTFRVGFSKVASLRVPGLTLPGQGIAVLERGTAGANGHPSAGLIGADLIKTLVVEIDYRAATLVLHDPAHFTYDGPGHVLPINLDANDKPQLDGRITLPNGDTLRARFGLDTGDRGLLTLHRHFVALHDLDDRLTATVPIMVGLGVGGPVRHHTARLDAIQLGDWSVPQPQITFPPLGASDAYTGRSRDGLLGARLLHDARVFLDYSNRRIIVEPQGDERPAEDASGLFLVAEGEQLDQHRIAHVAPGSPADVAGLRLDDRITLLDGVPTIHLSLDEMRRQLSRAGQEIVLEVERDGQTSFHTLKMRPLI